MNRPLRRAVRPLLLLAMTLGLGACHFHGHHGWHHGCGPVIPIPIFWGCCR